MRQSYEEYIKEFCSLIGYDKPERLMEGGTMSMNGLMFTLIHDDAIDKNKIFLFANFGEVPFKKQARVMKELLIQNHASYTGDGPGFTMSPRTGNVNYAMHVPLDKINPGLLANRMIALTHIAVDWRSSHFLAERVEEQAVAH